MAGKKKQSIYRRAKKRKPDIVDEKVAGKKQYGPGPIKFRTIPEIDIKIEKIEVTAKTRRLRAKWH